MLAGHLGQCFLCFLPFVCLSVAIAHHPTETFTAALRQRTPAASLSATRQPVFLLQRYSSPRPPPPRLVSGWRNQNASSPLPRNKNVDDSNESSGHLDDPRAIPRGHRWRRYRHWRDARPARHGHRCREQGEWTARGGLQYLLRIKAQGAYIKQCVLCLCFARACLVERKHKALHETEAARC